MPVRTEGQSVGDFLRARPVVSVIAIAAVVILASNGSSWALWLLLGLSLGMSTVIAASTIRSSMTIDATGVTDSDGLRTRHYPWHGSAVDSAGPPRRRAVLIGYQRSRFGKGSQRHLVVCCADDRRPHALKGARVGNLGALTNLLQRIHDAGWPVNASYDLDPATWARDPRIATADTKHDS